MRAAWLAMLVAVPLRAQDALTCSGYVAEFFAAGRMNADIARLLTGAQDQQTNVLRIRLRPSAGLWEGALLGAEYEASAEYRSAPSVVGSFGTANRRQVFALTWSKAQSPSWTTMHGFDRLQLQQDLGDVRLVLGRQRIAWGTGRIWNPTDLFNPLNPLVPSKVEKDGVDAVMARISFASFTDLSAVCNPQRGWGRVNTGVRFRTNVSEVDVSVMGGAFDRRTVIGADVAGSILEAGFRVEGLAAYSSGGAAVPSFVLGLDNQFSSHWYGMAEYYRNGDGADDRSRYDLLRLAAGEIVALARNYVAFSSSVQVHPLVTATATVIRNLDDGSGSAHAMAAWAVTSECTLTLGVQVFTGSRLTEYWLYPDAGYAKVDWYF